jgi:hypothetical protein
MAFLLNVDVEDPLLISGYKIVQPIERSAETDQFPTDLLALFKLIFGKIVR